MLNEALAIAFFVSASTHGPIVSPPSARPNREVRVINVGRRVRRIGAFATFIGSRGPAIRDVVAVVQGWSSVSSAYLY